MCVKVILFVLERLKSVKVSLFVLERLKSVKVSLFVLYRLKSVKVSLFHTWTRVFMFNTVKRSCHSGPPLEKHNCST